MTAPAPPRPPSASACGFSIRCCIGRGKLDDYPRYVKGCDIVSFDIYPVVHRDKEVSGRLEYVPRGVERLVKWSKGSRIVWNCIECMHISNPPAIATPQQIVRLAAVINGPEPAGSAKASSSGPGAPVAVMTREYRGAIYVFAVGMRNKQTTATFELPRPASGQIEVIDEGRSLPVRNGRFQDTFKPYEVHLYRLSAPGHRDQVRLGPTVQPTGAVAAAIVVLGSYQSYR